MVDRNVVGPKPSFVVSVVNSPLSFTRAINDSVPVFASNDIYASLGVTAMQFVAWQQRYGVDSLGVAPDGTVFIPKYPVFSKVAWSHVDSVTLTPFETQVLAEECERAETNAQSSESKQELQSIGALARKAVALNAVLRFGHA
jgi:hypothetical protein